MATINGPFLIDENIRKEERKKIDEFLDEMPKQVKNLIVQESDPNSAFITKLHFVTSIGNISRVLYPVGTIIEDTAFVYIPEGNEVYDPVINANRIHIYNNLINQLIRKNPKKWVLDFRGNGGGLVQTFFLYLYRFVKSAQIEYTSGRIYKLIGDKFYMSDRVVFIYPEEKKVKAEFLEM